MSKAQKKLSPAKMQEERLNLVNEIFDLFDKNQNGTIETSELNSIMIAIGRNPDKNELEQFTKLADSENTGKVTKSEFLRALEEFYSVPQETVDQVINAFAIFDKNNNGKIKLNELKHILLKYCDDFNEEECDKIFEMIDTDGSGEISYKEFVEAWKMQ